VGVAKRDNIFLIPASIIPEGRKLSFLVATIVLTLFSASLSAYLTISLFRQINHGLLHVQD
jgi:hypothetical protein